MNASTRLPSAAQFASYAGRLGALLGSYDWSPVARLSDELLDCWKTGRTVYLCGNGGSAANAVHLANDFLYVLAKGGEPGLRVQALPANQAIVTCLANDVGYDKVFSFQLASQARPGDVLIVLSGSGNSPNILDALHEARRIGMRSYAVLGYSGGKAKALADVPIHFAIDDMQISEDAQLIVGHMLMQSLAMHRDKAASAAAPVHARS